MPYVINLTNHSQIYDIYYPMNTIYFPGSERINSMSSSKKNTNHLMNHVSHLYSCNFNIKILKYCNVRCISMDIGSWGSLLIQTILCFSEKKPQLLCHIFHIILKSCMSSQMKCFLYWCIFRIPRRIRSNKYMHNFRVYRIVRNVSCVMYHDTHHITV